VKNSKATLEAQLNTQRSLIESMRADRGAAKVSEWHLGCRAGQISVLYMKAWDSTDDAWCVSCQPADQYSSPGRGWGTSVLHLVF